MCSADLFLALIAILFPPLAVWVKRGICSADSLINIALFCLGYLPGLLHAWYIIAKYPDPIYELVPHDAEGGARITTCYYVSPPMPQQTYGTTQPASSSASAPPPPAQTHVPSMKTSAAGEGGPSTGGGILPSYAEAVEGDFKVQNHD